MKKLIKLALVLTMVLSLLACSVASAKTLTWKSSTLGNEELAQTQGIFEFKRVLEEVSGGTIKLDAFINGTLYNQSAATDAILAGDLEFNLSTFGFLGTLYAPANMFGKAYNFNDYDHFVAFLNSEAYQKFSKNVDEHAGVHIVSMWYNGARTLNPKWAEPVMTPEDLKGKILRTPNNPGMINMGEALGATVSPIDFGELYTALQMGTVDAEENSLPQIKAGNFHEVTEQVTLTNHQIEIIPLIVPIDFWNGLTEEQQAWVNEAAEAGRVKCDTMNIESEKSLAAWFEEQGIVVVTPDLAAFQAYAANYYETNNLMADWDMDLYNALMELAK